MSEHHEGEVRIEKAESVTVEARSSGQALGVSGAIVLGSVLIAASIYFGLANMSGGGLFVGSGGGGTDTPTPTIGTGGDPSVPIVVGDITSGDLPVLGDPNAPVLVVEWSDYQCPFCKRLYDDVEKKIIEQYVDQGKVAFAYRDFAFLGSESNTASNAARCANEQGKFWEYHDVLWDQHPGSGHGDHLTPDKLKATALSLGLNAAQFNECVDSNKYAADVLADTNAGRAAGVTGTPSTFINGRVVNGAQPFSAFQQIIDDELDK